MTFTCNLRLRMLRFFAKIDYATKNTYSTPFCKISLFWKSNQIVQHVSREIEKKNKDFYLYKKTTPQEGHTVVFRTKQ